MKIASKNSWTPLSEKRLRKGFNKPDLISVMFRKYAPITITIIPRSLISVGFSLRKINAKIKVKMGLKAEIGASKETGEKVKALYDA